MKERGIIMSAPMVRAVLREKDPKTQTRRIVKDPPIERDGWLCTRRITFRDAAQYARIAAMELCPYGKPGDRLWVRETWQPHPDAGTSFPGITVPSDAVCYAADLSPGEVGESGPWKPSIHMPRRASRLTLEISEVRVERLQEISEEDAIAEGVDAVSMDAVRRQATWSRRQDFAQLWDRLNAKRVPWDSNPWVWVIGFRRASD